MELNTTPREGRITRVMEKYTARIPSATFLSFAVASMFVSFGIAAFSKKRTLANFLGLWAPTIMLIGVYNKLVKLEGSDHSETIH